MFQLFVDFTCPYCAKGFALYEEVCAKLGRNPKDADLIPVEAHPRDEEPLHRPHADLVAMAALYVKKRGWDVFAYARAMFKAIHERGLSPENIMAVTYLAQDVFPKLDSIDFTCALKGKPLSDMLNASNSHAYDDCNVWAVPTFIAPDLRLDATELVGVTADEIETFLNAI